MGPGNGRPGRKQAGAGRAGPVVAFDAAIAVRDDDAAVDELGAEDDDDAAVATDDEGRLRKRNENRSSRYLLSQRFFQMFPFLAWCQAAYWDIVIETFDRTINASAIAFGN